MGGRERKRAAFRLFAPVTRKGHFSRAGFPARGGQSSKTHSLPDCEVAWITRELNWITNYIWGIADDEIVHQDPALRQAAGRSPRRSPATAISRAPGAFERQMGNGEVGA